MFRKLKVTALDVVEFDRLWQRTKLKVNVGQRKIMVFERIRQQSHTDLRHRAHLYKIWLEEKMMGEVIELRY